MAEFVSVCIGIQARSGSNRFPRKAFAMIGDKPMLQHVIDACRNAAHQINRNTHRTRWIAQVALLIPKGDEIRDAFRGDVPVVEGPEDDVLSRYVQMSRRFKPDYIVRITGDCPLIPPPVIQHQAKVAIMNQYDYCSNVDPRVRTSPDGFDCETFSSKILEYTDANAKDQKDREHVTTYMRSNPPEWAKIGHVIGYSDLSGIKWSVDTEAEHAEVCKVYQAVKDKEAVAEQNVGKSRVHKF